MTDHSGRLRDPELDRLVLELNGERPAERSAHRSLGVDTGADGRFAQRLAPLVASGRRAHFVDDEHPLEPLLATMVRVGASDLFLLTGHTPTMRVEGNLVTPEAVERLDSEDLAALFTPHLIPPRHEQLEAVGAVDFSLCLAGGSDASGGWRFRVNLHRQRGELAAAIRALPRKIPSLADLHLPSSLAELTAMASGLILVCGPTGAGKSSTLAALMSQVNRAARRHVITIEDPIEYEHKSDRSLIEQIEVGRDTPSFAHALRAALRQDPDILLIGEMRDLESVRSALTAAETGHLVLATLHTHDSAQAIHRIVDVFPPNDREQIRHQLALSLNAIITQQLVLLSDGSGRVPAVEILIANHAVRHQIRENKLQRIYNELTLGKRQGMISLEDSLVELVRQGLIDEEDARLRSARPEALESLLRG